MFSRTFVQAALVLVLALQVHGHAAVAPVLGVTGNPVRADVKRPNNINPCGAGVNIASEFDSSTAAPADATGSFNGVVSNFNKLLDGSRQVSAAVDPTGTGASFTPMTVTTNGDKISKDLGSQPIVAQLPAGTVCTGGATGNKCLVQFKNVVGFGNCMVVSQDSSASANSTANSTADDSSSTTIDSSLTSTATDSADLATATDDVFSTDSSDFSTASVTDLSSATITAAAATATNTAAFGSATSESSNDEGASAIAQKAGGKAAGANLGGNAAGAASGIKSKIAGKLAGLKGKLQGAAKVPGTRAARSLMAELSGIDH